MWHYIPSSTDTSTTLRPQCCHHTVNTAYDRLHAVPAAHAQVYFLQYATKLVTGFNALFQSSGSLIFSMHEELGNFLRKLLRKFLESSFVDSIQLTKAGMQQVLQELEADKHLLPLQQISLGLPTQKYLREVLGIDIERISSTQQQRKQLEEDIAAWEQQCAEKTREWEQQQAALQQQHVQLAAKVQALQRQISSSPLRVPVQTPGGLAQLLAAASGNPHLHAALQAYLTANHQLQQCASELAALPLQVPALQLPPKPGDDGDEQGDSDDEDAEPQQGSDGQAGQQRSRDRRLADRHIVALSPRCGHLLQGVCAAGDQPPAAAR